MKKEKEIYVWWKFIKSEVKNIRTWFCFLIGALVFECILSSIYLALDVPQITLMEILEIAFSTIAGAYKTLTFDDNHSNPILVVLACFSIWTVFNQLSKWRVKGKKDRYDSLFLMKSDRSKQHIGKKIGFGALFFVLSFILFLINIFNIADSLVFGGKSKLAFIIISFIVIILGIIWECIKMKEDGRTNILAYMSSFYFIMIWALYPVKEGSLVWISIHSLLAAVTSIILVDILGADFATGVSIYSFRSETGKRLYIHYRLDDERIVCSPETKLEPNSERIIYAVSDLCKREIKRDTSVYDREWLSVISEIRRIRSDRRKIREWIRIVFSRCKSFAGAILSSVKSYLEKARRVISIINKQRKKICRLKRENKGLKQEIANLSKDEM